MWVCVRYGGEIEEAVAKLNSEHPHSVCPIEDGYTVLSGSTEFNEMNKRLWVILLDCYSAFIDLLSQDLSAWGGWSC